MGRICWLLWEMSPGEKRMLYYSIYLKLNPSYMQMRSLIYFYGFYLITGTERNRDQNWKFCHHLLTLMSLKPVWLWDTEREVLNHILHIQWKWGMLKRFFKKHHTIGLWLNHTPVLLKYNSSIALKSHSYTVYSNLKVHCVRFDVNDTMPSCALNSIEGALNLKH